MARLLCVDDDETMLLALQRILSGAGHEVITAANAGIGLQLLQNEKVDLIISDFQLPGIDGIEFVTMLRRDRDMTPVIMLTGYGSIDNAMAAVRAGANDYLRKPIDPAQLLHRLDQALTRLQLERQLDELRAEVLRQRSAKRILGKSPALDKALELAAATARSRATVLLEGESGTGKEMIAREIHELSDQHNGPFIKLNCAAIPEGLIESALFGHEKGAFTGAIRRVEGAFERADGGSLLLDEISEMRIDLQAKLLRVLQEREFERVGGSQTIRVNVRVIATTNRDLEAEVRRGTFRRDLFYRLNVIPIVVPPLRERLSDVPMLVHHFALGMAEEAHKQIDGVSAGAMELLQSYSWPGNVRELQHVVERAVVLSTGPILDEHAFDGIQRTVRDQRSTLDELVAPAPANGGASSGLTFASLNLADAEDALIKEALRVAGNNRTRAAALLGIGVRTLRKKLNAPRDANAAVDDSRSDPPRR